MSKELENITGKVIVLGDKVNTYTFEQMEAYAKERIAGELGKLLKMSSVHAETTKVLGTVRAEIVFRLEQLKQK